MEMEMEMEMKYIYNGNGVCRKIKYIMEKKWSI